MGADPRLPQMPDKPTLIDFFKTRFASTNHLLQSATHALKNGHNEKVVLACLLHDIGVGELHPLRPRLLGRADDRALCRRGGELGGAHAPGAALLPRLRRSATNIRRCTSSNFGADYKPEPYIVAEYERAREPQMVHDARA